VIEQELLFRYIYISSFSLKTGLAGAAFSFPSRGFSFPNQLRDSTSTARDTPQLHGATPVFLSYVFRLQKSVSGSQWAIEGTSLQKRKSRTFFPLGPFPSRKKGNLRRGFSRAGTRAFLLLRFNNTGPLEKVNSYVTAAPRLPSTCWSTASRSFQPGKLHPLFTRGDEDPFSFLSHNRRCLFSDPLTALGGGPSLPPDIARSVPTI